MMLNEMTLRLYPPRSFLGVVGVGDPRYVGVLVCPLFVVESLRSCDLVLNGGVTFFLLVASLRATLPGDCFPLQTLGSPCSFHLRSTKSGTLPRAAFTSRGRVSIFAAECARALLPLLLGIQHEREHVERELGEIETHGPETALLGLVPEHVAPLTPE